MYVSKISLRNWKNFESVEIPLQRRMFIIGPNASGKSNFLDAFRFLHDVAKPGGGLQEAMSSRGGMKKVRTLTAKRLNDVMISIELKDEGSNAEWNYTLGMVQETSGSRNLLISNERVVKNGSVLLERPDEEDKKDKLRLSQSHLEQISANTEFRQIADYLQKMLYLHIVPQLIRNPDSFSGPGIPGDPFGRNFIERIARTNKKTRDARLKKVNAALREILPQLDDLKLEQDIAGKYHLSAKYVHWRPNAGYQDENQFSDGTLRLIGLLWAILDGNSLLLLEEPELSLNSEIVSLLPQLISKVTRKKNRQLILSTHSYDLLNTTSIGQEEILVLETTDNAGTRVLPVSSIPESASMMESGFTPAESVLRKVQPKINPRQTQLSLFG